MDISSVSGASEQQVQQLATASKERLPAEVIQEQQQEQSQDEVEISTEARALGEGNARGSEATESTRVEEETADNQISSGGDVNDLAGLVNSGQGSVQGTLLDTTA